MTLKLCIEDRSGSAASFEIEISTVTLEIVSHKRLFGIGRYADQIKITDAIVVTAKSPE